MFDDRWHELREQLDPRKPADDAPWQTVYDYVAKKSPPTMTVARVNQYIRRLHKHGMYGLMYFNPTEAWKLWIEANYPGDLVLSNEGRHVPEWKESLLLCPNPDSPWGKYLLDTFATMMDLYPEADGFFMDQSTYDRLDYAHDDGWSIQDGRTAYRMGWAIDQISRRCREMAKARGKFLWWNGPYLSDIAYYAEGMMAEAGNAKEVHSIQYLMMGSRACCTLARAGETTLQDCAAFGMYPTVMQGSAAQLASRYWPVFELFRGKRWVFNAHALDLPQGTEGNLWRLPDGNVLVDVATAGRNDRRQVVRREPASDRAFARRGRVPRGLFPFARLAGQAAADVRSRRQHAEREHSAPSQRVGYSAGQDGRASQPGRRLRRQGQPEHRRCGRVGQLDRPGGARQVDFAGLDGRAVGRAGGRIPAAAVPVPRPGTTRRPAPSRDLPDRHGRHGPRRRFRVLYRQAMNVIDIPFNRFLGIREAQGDGPHLLELAESPDYLNHLGTVHAGAQLALAEAGSGQCLLAALPQCADEAVAVVRRVEAKFKSPMRGPIFARAATTADQLRQSAEPLAAKGRAIIPVAVEIVDRNGAVGLVATFEWFAKNRSAARPRRVNTTSASVGS